MSTDFSQRKLIGKYSKKYAYAPYLNEDIGWEMECLPGDDPMEVQEYLKSLSDQTHKKNNPHLYTEHTTPVDKEERMYREMGIITDEDLQKQSQHIDTRTVIEKYTDEMNKCNTKEQLEKEWNLLSKSNPKLKEAYQSKLKSLTI